MLQHLSITNYAIIDSLEIDFEKGFSVLTGETGSGKSIILGALQLIMGQRADSKSIGTASNKCIIEAVLTIENYHLESFFEQADLDFEPNHTLIRREILTSGKSRAFINDSPVKLEVLKEFSQKVIDIHSQHQTLLLNKANYQLNLIDSLAKVSFKGHATLLDTYLKEYTSLLEHKKELKQLLHQGDESKAQLDYLSFLLEELEEANLVEGEKESLESSLKLIESREEVSSALQKVSYLIENNHSLEPISTQLLDLENDLQKIASYNKEYTELYERVRSVSIELSDVSKESEGLLSKMEHQEVDTEELNHRINTINLLEQKHRVLSFTELLEKQVELRAKVAQLNFVDEHIANIETEIERLNAILIALASKINANRKKVSSKIESQIEVTLKDLGIKNGQFKVDIQNSENLNEWGSDELNFLFSANKGVPLQEIAKVASGGETSRLMLALKALLANYLKLPCLILDEIDTGVSGEIAGKIAKILAEMASDMQLIVISHLPQVAAKAHTHYKVAKEDVKGKTQTSIVKLAPEDRIDELAKMLSGETISAAALENAKALMVNH